jgi:hypothetical protein
MRAQVNTVLASAAALLASVAAHPATTAARQTAVTLPGLSWSLSFAIEDWLSPYYPGPDGYSRWTGHWDVFAGTGYVDGLPGFSVAVRYPFSFIRFAPFFHPPLRSWQGFITTDPLT